jgi:glycerophosphoryl diester phosphodiesterase
MNTRYLLKLMRNALLTIVGSSLWIVLVGLSAPTNVFAGPSRPLTAGTIILNELQDNLPLQPNVLITPQLAVPLGRSSDNHTLDDCIRNPICNDVLSVGHRGTIIWGPENTIAAFKAAIGMGADAVEMDVRNTKDGKLILMHDATLDRTTNCSGQISQKTWNEIKNCKVLPILPGIQSDNIPTFSAALSALKGKTVIDLDVKTTLIDQVASEIKAAKIVDQVMVLTSSKDAAMFYADNDIAVLALADTYNKVLDFLKMPIKPIAIEVDIKLLPFVQKKVHSSGSRIFVDALGACDLIGVNCYRQLARLRADLIQTDNLPKLVPFLEKVN